MTCLGPHAAPWRIEMDDGDVTGIYGKPCDEYCSGRIVETDHGYYPPRRADAERIVEAVNHMWAGALEGG